MNITGCLNKFKAIPNSSDRTCLIGTLKLMRKYPTIVGNLKWMMAVKTPDKLPIWFNLQFKIDRNSR